MTQPPATPSEPTPSEPSRNGPLRRIAAAAVIGVLFFIVLWVTVFHAVTAALVSTGGAVVLVAGSSVSDSFQSLFDMVAEFVLGVFAAIADFFSSLFS